MLKSVTEQQKMKSNQWKVPALEAGQTFAIAEPDVLDY
jgi:hypothetical protein